MHPNPVFRQATGEQNADFARERGFGALSLNGVDGPLIAHVPFLLSEDGNWLELHLVRSNPITRATDAPTQAVMVVSGPDSYVSPDWYETENLVPTWNYVAVHLRGTLHRLEQAELPALLDRLSEFFERRLAPKPIWTSAKVKQEALARMERQIVPFRMQISKIDGTWKLGQNKPENARLAAARQVKTAGIGQERAILAGLMMAPDDRRNAE